MQPVREVYSLLMPVQNGRLVLPRAAISEVMGYTTPKDRPADAPDFLLGFIDWQGQKIPLVSFEAACGRPVPELSRRARIAVVFTIGERLSPNAMAVVTQGYPYLVRVNPGVLLSEQLQESDENSPVLARVRMANERPIIPDIEKLEFMLADALGISAEAPAEVAAEDVDELDAFGGDEEAFETGLLESDSGEEDAPPASSLEELSGSEEEFEAVLLESGEDDEAMPEFDVAESEPAADEAMEAGDYAAELSELESALGGDETGEEEISLEGFEIDDETTGEDSSNADVKSGDDDEEAFDFGDIDLDDIEFGDDEEESPGKE